MSEEVVLISGVRTAIGRFGQSFRNMPAPKLGAAVIKEAVNQAGIKPESVDEVIMGNVISAGLGQNPARQAAIYAGLPVAIGAVTINKVCGSGLKSVMIAAQAIRAGDADIIVAGGMENMSCAPHLLRNLRWGVKLGDSPMVDAMQYDGLWDVYNEFLMGITGENVAKKYGVTRKEADEFALKSNQKALKAIKKGKFNNEIVPVEVDGSVIDKDECVREDSSIEKLAKLPIHFSKDGVLTAGNSSKLSDGAAALVVASATKARELGLKPMARILGYGTGGLEPESVMEAPIPTVRNLLKKTNFTIEDMDLVEHNEAYSTASIVVSRELKIDDQKFNVNGGAVALGHPIGASGARVLVTLLHALCDRKLKRGLVTLCLGGGNAVAMIIER
jgi:acetyl-CoA C-acetyltransferase